MDVQTFVVAAIVAAFFLADRIGGQEQVGRHLFQATLGFALALTLMSATTAFLRAGDVDYAELANQDSHAISSLFGNDSGSTTRDGASIRLGFGFAFLLLGFWSTTRWNTLPLGIALGGLLLLLVGGGVTASFDVNSLTSNGIFGSLFGKAEQGSDIAHFIVMLIGTLALLGFGYRQWEKRPGAVVAATAPV